MTREEWWRQFSEIGQSSHERTDMASMFCDLLAAAFEPKEAAPSRRDCAAEGEPTR